MAVTAGTNHPLAFHSSLIDLAALRSHYPRTLNKYKSLAYRLGAMDLFQDLTSRLKDITQTGNTPQTYPVLGKLAVKYEAAGKVRIFAIGDYWIQCLSAPFHRLFFSYLKQIPQVDGTFDQEGLVKRMAKRKYSHAYSYDLKAATDMIPLELYQVLFKSQHPEALVWLDAVCDRDFRVPNVEKEDRGS
jgi:hypothetical protein